MHQRIELPAREVRAVVAVCWWRAQDEDFWSFSVSDERSLGRLDELFDYCTWWNAGLVSGLVKGGGSKF